MQAIGAKTDNTRQLGNFTTDFGHQSLFGQKTTISQQDNNHHIICSTFHASNDHQKTGYEQRIMNNFPDSFSHLITGR